MSTIWKWLDWKPVNSTSAESGKTPPRSFQKPPSTTPQNPQNLQGSDPGRGFEGFEGPSSAPSPKIEAGNQKCRDEAKSNTLPRCTGRGPEEISPVEGLSLPGAQNASARPDVPFPKDPAAELWSDRAGDRVFIVTAEEDAQEAMERFGATRGEVWTSEETKLVARITDPAIRAEVMAFKRTLSGALSPAKPGVDKATEGSQENHEPSDFLGQFLEHLCVTAPGGQVKVVTLYEFYRRWAESSGDRVASEKRFSSRMQAHLGVKGGEVSYVL